MKIQYAPLLPVDGRAAACENTGHGSADTGMSGNTRADAHGQTHVDISIHGDSWSVVVSALADTAATFTKIPRVVLDELGLEPEYEVEVEIGDGRTILRQLVLADVELSGVRRPVLVSAGGNGEQTPRGLYDPRDAGVRGQHGRP